MVTWKQIISMWLVWASVLQAQDSAPLPEGVSSISIGVTRLGTPIQALITRDDLNIDSPKHRILIVAGLDVGQASSAIAKRWMSEFYALPEAKRHNLALSLIVSGKPDGPVQGQLHEIVMDAIPVGGYPPAGEAYLSPTNPESQYIWRWIGMHAPDLVIVLFASSFERIVDKTIYPADSLAPALANHNVCEVGPIDSVIMAVQKDGQLPMNEVSLLARQAQAKPNQARSVLQQRIHRTPLEVANQLSKVYGHELPSVAYIPAVACLARLRLAKLSSDENVLPDLMKLTEAYRAGSKPTLTDKSTASDIAGHILWGELFDATGDERLRELAKSAADRAFDAKGQPLEAMPMHSEMSDSVFMGCPILAQVGRLTGDAKYYDMCLKHMRFMNKLNLRSDGLHRHSPLDETAWGRGNGFPALGLALALEEIPAEYAGRAEILASFQAHLQALLPHQDLTGAWHQVIDHPESYRELTSTCMITYAMIRGVRRGWLDRKTYEPAIAKAWTAIKARVGEDGSLVDVCTGTGKMKSLREYLDRTAILGKDPRGGAMSLLVATEMSVGHVVESLRDSKP